MKFNGTCFSGMIILVYKHVKSHCATFCNRTNGDIACTRSLIDNTKKPETSKFQFVSSLVGTVPISVFFGIRIDVAHTKRCFHADVMCLYF